MKRKCKTYEPIFVKHAFYFINMICIIILLYQSRTVCFTLSTTKWKLGFQTTNHSTFPRQFHSIEFCLRNEALNKCIASFGGFLFCQNFNFKFILPFSTVFSFNIRFSIFCSFSWWQKLVLQSSDHITWVKLYLTDPDRVKNSLCVPKELYSPLGQNSYIEVNFYFFIPRLCVPCGQEQGFYLCIPNSETVLTHTNCSLSFLTTS